MRTGACVVKLKNRRLAECAQVLALAASTTTINLQPTVCGPHLHTQLNRVRMRKDPILTAHSSRFTPTQIFDLNGTFRLLLGKPWLEAMRAVHIYGPKDSLWFPNRFPNTTMGV